MSWKRSLFIALAWLPLRLLAAPPMLMVQGNQFVTVSGHCPVNLHGVDVSGLEYNVKGDGPAGANPDLSIVQAAVNTWKSNFVRLNLNQDFWLGNGCGTNGSATGDVGVGYQNLVLAIVNWCNANNVYVLLDLHWSDLGQPGQNQVCGGAGANGQHDMPDSDSTLFWQSVASNATIQNNPAVFFDLYNEPGGGKNGSALTNNAAGWALWRNGGTEPSSSDGVAYATPGMQGLLNTIRTAGANNIIFAGGENWAFDVNDMGTYNVWLTDTGSGNGVAYPTHIYPFKQSNNGCNTPACFSTAANATTLAKVPVVVTEFGADSGMNPGAFVPAILSWINTNKLSYTAWTLTNGSDPSLINGYFTPNSYFGVPVQTALAAAPTPGCPAGTNTVTLTPAPSSTATPSPTPTVSLTPLPACGMATLVRVACGSTTAVTDSSGNVWSADYGYSGGSTSNTTTNITGTTSPALYQNNRWASPLTYSFNLPNGTYQVQILNSENYWTAAGDRVFNIALQGVTVISGYDIFAAAGGQYKATSLTFTAVVSNGTLSIVGTATTDNAQFDAIQISWVGQNCPSPTSTPSLTRSPSATATATASPTRSASPSATATATPSVTRSASPSATATATPSVTPTASPSATATATPSVTRSASPSATATATPSVTSTASPSATATATPRVTPSATVTATPGPTHSASPTATLLAQSPTVTPSDTATVIFSASPSPFSSVTASATNTPKAGSPTPTGTVTGSPMASPTFTVNGSPSVTDTPNTSPSRTYSPAVTPSVTSSPLRSATATVTGMPSFSASPTLTPSSTATASATPTSSPSPSTTASPTVSATASPSPSGSPNDTATTTPSASPTAAASATDTASPTSTASATTMATPTATPNTVSTASATPSSTASSTPAPEGPPSEDLKILSGLPVPNPNPQFFVVQLNGPADTVDLDLYTKAYVLAFHVHLQNARAGYNHLELPAGFRQAASGVYFGILKAKKGGTTAPALRVKVMVLRGD